MYSDGQFQFSGRRECSDGQLGNRKNNQYGRKKYNLRSRGHVNHVEQQTVNAIEAESSSHFVAHLLHHHRLAPPEVVSASFASFLRHKMFIT